MAHRFLVVDDTNFMRKMATDCLSEFGYEVAGEATNGKEAIRLYEELRPDVVMMDLTMPEMNGTEATKAILGINPEAVILICTASNEKELILEAMDAGAKGYIMKPFNQNRLQEVIRKYAEPYLTMQLDAEETEPESEMTEPESEMTGIMQENLLGSPVEEPTSYTGTQIALDIDRGNGRVKSFVSSFMCQWQEDRNGGIVEYSVVCTESENKLVIETDNKAEKQVITFTLQGFRELADWLDNHLGARQGTM
ncbi:response regulator [Cohnella luojiensis]|uniref:Response regulator n=1 Tax=Cohnella luojiensis TaxID=652876 RepID=A0A4Y8M0V7_9BACL|nr:response regulator [Cohnella luojiensis]TFE28627.1 response regulator [Cohnella luojiensis]